MDRKNFKKGIKKNMKFFNRIHRILEQTRTIVTVVIIYIECISNNKKTIIKQ